MGVGTEIGGVPISRYINPRNGPFVLAWYVCVVALSIAIDYWLFFRNGVEDLVEHPGLVGLSDNRLWVIKTYLLFGSACSLIGLCVMIFGNFQFGPPN